MQGVNLSDCSYPPTETMWAGFTHWSVFPSGCLTFIKNGWEDHSGNFTIKQNCQASLFLKVMHGRSTTILKRYPDPGSDASSVWNFCGLFSDVIWGEASDSVAKCRLFSQGTGSKASFESPNWFSSSPCMVANCKLISLSLMVRSLSSWVSNSLCRSDQKKTLWVARRYTSNSIPEDPKFDLLPWEAVHAPRPPGRSAQNSGNFG